MEELIMFLLGNMCGVLILAISTAGGQKEKERRAYKKGYRDAMDGLAFADSRDALDD